MAARGLEYLDSYFVTIDLDQMYPAPLSDAGEIIAADTLTKDVLSKLDSQEGINSSLLKKDDESSTKGSSDEGYEAKPRSRRCCK